RAAGGVHLRPWRSADRRGPAHARAAQRGNLRRARPRAARSARWVSRRTRGPAKSRRDRRRAAFLALRRRLIRATYGGAATSGARPMVKYPWAPIHLRTTNPEAPAQWYERMLGAEVIRPVQQGKPRIDLKLGGANIFIAPVAPGDGVNPPPVTPYQGLDHF